MRNAYKVMVGNLQRRRLFGILKPRWENNIKMDVKAVVQEHVSRYLWLRTGSSGGLL
jgi:hypothetical protein